MKILSGGTHYMLKEGIKFVKLANNFRKLKTLDNAAGGKRAAQYLCRWVMKKVFFLYSESLMSLS